MSASELHYYYLTDDHEQNCLVIRILFQLFYMNVALRIVNIRINLIGIETYISLIKETCLLYRKHLVFRSVDADEFLELSNWEFGKHKRKT